MKKIGFIGAGNMGGALAAAVAKSQNKVYLSDACREKAEALASEISAEAADTAEIIENCDLVFLGVKPQILPIVAKEICKAVAARKESICLVSMAAGVTLSQLSEFFTGSKIIRIMPNTPA